jgi:hypothetical protein
MMKPVAFAAAAVLAIGLAASAQAASPAANVPAWRQAHEKEICL